MTLAAIFLAGGCATTPNPERHDGLSSPDQPALPAQREYKDAVCSALVFDPPVIAGLPPVNMQRDLRQPAAFVGYETGTATYFDVSTYDRVANDGTTCFSRTVQMDKVGMSYR